jgi:hypothetical protein
MRPTSHGVALVDLELDAARNLVAHPRTRSMRRNAEAARGIGREGRGGRPRGLDIRH